jgi:tetratricopeptide (TPR) repeat protein
MYCRGRETTSTEVRTLAFRALRGPPSCEAAQPNATFEAWARPSESFSGHRFMDKHRKLRKYRQKDYSMMVEFPVEIVGRNGVVRTYSFEDSVRLYQRRIASAASRYDDSELVRAEIDHCRQRIRQLRRSYYERYAWAAIRSLSKREVAGGEMAAEVAAFLARYAGSIDRAERYEIKALECSGAARVWYLSPPAGEPLLLYQYKLSAADDCPSRAAMEAFLASLGSCAPEDEVEHLHASFDNADCGLILTGSQAFEEREEPSEDLELDRVPGDVPDPVTQAVALLRAGSPERALQLLESLLAIQPDHRSASLTAALAAGHLGMPKQAELFVRLAMAYHPDDAILLHQLGIALLQQDRLDEAEQAFGDALELQPWLFPSRLLLILLALHDGQMERSAVLLRQGDPRMERGQRDALRAIRSLLRRARWRRMSLVGGAVACCASAAWWALGQPLALPCFLGTITSSVLLILLTRRPKPLAVAHDIARRMQVPREMLPPSSDGWEES